MRLRYVVVWVLLTGIASPQKTSPQVNHPTSFAQLFDHWLQQDVRWIIKNQERAAALKLNTDEDKINFVETFWWNHNLVPASSPNGFKQEHYKRLLLANQLFARTGKPGWATEQGRVYVTLGPPNWTRSQSGAPDATSEIISKCPGNVQKPATSVVWRYMYASNGNPLTITFADYCGTGELQPVVSEPEPEQPTQSRYVTVCEGRFTFDTSKGPVAFECLGVSPTARFKDLEEVVTHKVNYKMVPFDVQTNTSAVTDATQMLEIVVSAKNPGTQCEEGKEPLHVFGRLTSTAGRIEETFEGTMNYSGCGTNDAKYSRSLPVFRGRHRLDIAVKDPKQDKIGTYTGEIDLPFREY